MKKFGPPMEEIPGAEQRPFRKRPEGGMGGSDRLFSRKRKACPFTQAKFKDIDYKDLDTLKRFITERGKILPRRVSGATAFFQRRLALAVKRARHMALLPFVGEA